MEKLRKNYYLEQLGIESWFARTQLPGAKVCARRQAYPAAVRYQFTDAYVRLQQAVVQPKFLLVSSPYSGDEQALAAAIGQTQRNDCAIATLAQKGQNTVKLTSLLEARPSVMIAGLALAKQLCQQITEQGQYTINQCPAIVAPSLTELFQQPRMKKVLWTKLQTLLTQ